MRPEYLPRPRPDRPDEPRPRCWVAILIWRTESDGGTGGWEDGEKNSRHLPCRSKSSLFVFIVCAANHAIWHDAGWEIEYITDIKSCLLLNSNRSKSHFAWLRVGFAGQKDIRREVGGKVPATRDMTLLFFILFFSLFYPILSLTCLFPFFSHISSLHLSASYASAR